MPTKVESTPKNQLSQSRIETIRESARQSALEVQMQNLNIQSESSMVVRDLLPAEDLGQGDNAFTFNVGSSGQFDEVVNNELDDGKTLTIHAITLLDANPDVNAIQFATGASDIQEISVDKALVQDEPTLFLESPVKYEENQTVRIAFYAESTGDKNVVFEGQVAEKEGENINPSDA